MLNKTIAMALGTALLSSVALTSTAATGTIDREKAIATYSGATGSHWYLGHMRHYNFNWQADGKLIVTKPGATEKTPPVATGTWRIKTVEKKKGDTDEMIAAANAALENVYCHQLDNLWDDNEICWDTDQQSMNVDANKKPSAKQSYKLYREGRGETGTFDITSR